MSTFDDSFQRRDSVIRANHGARWDESQQAQLHYLFSKNHSLEAICQGTQRAASAILSRLCLMGLLTLDENTGKYFRSDRPIEATHSPQPQPTDTMTTIATIESRTLINGQNAADMSDKEIFKVIAKLETEMRNLESVVTKPKKLVTAINALQADIEAVVAYVDARP